MADLSLEAAGRPVTGDLTPPADPIPAAPDLDGPGTPEAVWQSCRQLRDLRACDRTRLVRKRVVVVAPHPDDEILGVGGTMAICQAAGSLIELVAVTDGEASHPGREDQLRRRRPAESAAAARHLGVTPARTRRLTHPDGAVDEERLRRELAAWLHPDDLLLAPWQHDGHPDHDRTGRAAVAAGAATGATVVSYLVWAWQWASPQQIPWAAACRLDLGSALAERKRGAVGCFHSQLEGPAPILAPHVLSRLTRDHEVLVWT